MGNSRRVNPNIFVPGVLLSVFVVSCLLYNSPQLEPVLPLWSYVRFLEQVEAGQVEHVWLTRERTQALVTTKEGDQVFVDLEPDPDLISTLQTNLVDMTASGGDNLPAGAYGYLVTAAMTLSGLAFWVWVLVDCSFNEVSQRNVWRIWMLIIIVANVFGAIAYFFLRRPWRINQLGR